MAGGAEIGTRIRERRLSLGVKQAVLARQAGISPAYLNLIEHNRRGIAGKVLADIARSLGTEPAAFSDGADAGLVEALRAAAAAHPEVQADPAMADEIARRYPDWAALVAAQQRRIAHLRQTAEALSDRLTHDPHLAASLHELLSTVTAINSTASILVEPGDLEPEWRQRFHRNIHEDSKRAAEASQALVAYMDANTDEAQSAVTPQDTVEAWLNGEGYHMPALETAHPADPQALVAEAKALDTQSARDLAMAWCTRYRSDAALLPLAAFQTAARGADFDPLALAAQFGSTVSAVLRRLASLPGGADTPGFGLLLCDASGTLTHRKTIPGFPVPRFGAACPLWPLYKALNRPLSPIREIVEVAGRDQRRFLTYAIAEPVGVPRFEETPSYEAAMLILPIEGAPSHAQSAARLVGPSCRVCAHEGLCGAARALDPCVRRIVTVLTGWTTSAIVFDGKHSFCGPGEGSCE